MAERLRIQQQRQLADAERLQAEAERERAQAVAQACAEQEAWEEHHQEMLRHNLDAIAANERAREEMAEAAASQSEFLRLQGIWTAVHDHFRSALMTCDQARINTNEASQDNSTPSQRAVALETEQRAITLLKDALSEAAANKEGVPDDILAQMRTLWERTWQEAAPAVSTPRTYIQNQLRNLALWREYLE